MASAHLVCRENARRTHSYVAGHICIQTYVHANMQTYKMASAHLVCREKERTTHIRLCHAIHSCDKCVYTCMHACILHGVGPLGL